MASLDRKGCGVRENWFKDKLELVEHSSWSWDESKGYVVRDSYKVLLDGDDVTNFALSKFIWNKYFPRNISVFYGNRFNCRLKITSKKLGLVRADGDSCMFECEEREFIPHLFCNCSFVKNVWLDLFKWLEIPSNLAHEVSPSLDSVVGFLRR